MLNHHYNSIFLTTEESYFAPQGDKFGFGLPAGASNISLLSPNSKRRSLSIDKNDLSDSPVTFPTTLDGNQNPFSGYLPTFSSAVGGSKGKVAFTQSH